MTVDYRRRERDAKNVERGRNESSTLRKDPKGSAESS
jgi:ribosomal protein L13E